MGRLKARIKRLEQHLRGNRIGIVLADGSKYYFDPEEAFCAIFGHALQSLEADHHHQRRPPAPEILETLARARDRESAIAPLFAVGPQTLLSAFDLAALVERGELVPVSLTAGREYTAIAE